MTASFRINQDGIDGYTNRARRDIYLSAISGDVEFEALDLSHETYLWEIISAPPGADKTVTNPTTTFATFEVVDLGGFLVRLTVDEGLPTQDSKVLYFGVPLENSGLLLPAQGEVDFDNSQSPYDGRDGLHEKLYAFYSWVDANAGGGGAGTLQEAYEGGGAIAASSTYGSVAISVADTANVVPLTITQADVSNANAALSIINDACVPGSFSAPSIKLTGDGPQMIGSDKHLWVGVLNEGLSLVSYQVGATSDSCRVYIGAISYYSTDDSSIFLEAASLGGGANLTLRASGGGSPGQIHIGTDVSGDVLVECRNLSFEDSDLATSTWDSTTYGPCYLSSAESDWDTYVSNFGRVSLTNAINQAATMGGGGGGTLDAAYDYGGAGVGRTIDVDSGAVQLTVSDTDNNAALVLVQQDSTNNPSTLQITNNATTSLPSTPGSTGASIYLTSTNSKAQAIWSDQELYIGSNHDDGAIRLYGKTSTGNALVDVLSTSSLGQAFLSLAASSTTDDGVVELTAYGVSNTVKTSITISAYGAGTGDGEILLKSRSTGGNSRIVLGDAFTQSIRFEDKNLDDATWTATYVPLSSSAAQWNTYKSNFGETSLVDAVNQAYAAGGGGGTLQDWGYLGTTGPTGAAAPSLVYQFDGTASQFTDRMASGIDLSVTTGYRNMPLSEIGSTWCIRGLANDGYSPYTTNLSEALRSVGAITIEMVVYIQGYGAGDYLFSCSAAGETKTTNYLYALRIDSTAGKALLFTEYGVGVNTEIDPLAHFPFCTPLYLAVTRAANGVDYKMYFNSVLVGSVTAANAPEKDVSGNLQQLYLMRDSATGAASNTALSSFRITLEEFSQSQINEVWGTIKPQIV